jgi:hypothetical protein
MADVQACDLLGLSLRDLPDLPVDVAVVVSRDGEFFGRDQLLFGRKWLDGSEQPSTMQSTRCDVCSLRKKAKGLRQMEATLLFSTCPCWSCRCPRTWWWSYCLQLSHWLSYRLTNDGKSLWREHEYHTDFIKHLYHCWSRSRSSLPTDQRGHVDAFL